MSNQEMTAGQFRAWAAADEMSATALGDWFTLVFGYNPADDTIITSGMVIHAAWRAGYQGPFVREWWRMAREYQQATA